MSAALWLMLGCHGAETFQGAVPGMGAGGAGTGGQPTLDAPIEFDAPAAGATGGAGAGATGGAGAGGATVDAVDGTGGAAPMIDAPVVDAPAIDASAVDAFEPDGGNTDSAADTGVDRPVPDGGDVGQSTDPNAAELVGYWKFDEGLGTALRDSSTLGNNATIHSTVTWVTGAASLPPLTFANQAALSFNSDGYATAGTLSMPATNSKQTLSVWINIKATAGSDRYILCMWNTSLSQAISLGIHNGQLAAWSWGPTTLVAMAPPPLNTWHHLAYTFDGTTHRLYLDGGTPVTSAAPSDVAAVNRVEIASYNSGSLFAGQLDDLRIYKTVLTPAQIADLTAGKY